LREAFKISIIVPCYNYGHFLKECIESIKGQSFKNWECIIVNDGSTDNTAEVAKQYADGDYRIKYVEQVNSGLSAARNTGIQYSSAGWLQFLDADDCLHPSKLNIQIFFIEQYPEIDFWYTSFAKFDNDHPLNYTSAPLDSNVEIKDSDQILLSLLSANIMPVNAPLISKKLIDRIGFFDTKMRSLEDWDFWMRAAINTKLIGKIEATPLAYVRVHSGSMSTNGKVMIQSRIQLYQKTNKLIEASRKHFLSNDSIKDSQRLGLREYAGHIIFSEIKAYNFLRGFCWLAYFPYSSVKDLAFLIPNLLYSVKYRILKIVRRSVPTQKVTF
jgi:glycosyltransferase involved in cell wall biosynthesis